MTRRLVAGLAILLALAGAAHTNILSNSARAYDVRPDSTRNGPLTSVDSLKSLEKLASDINAILNLPAEVKAGKVGVQVKSLATDKVLFSMNADKPLTPASNTKVVTAFTALSDLGPNYVVKTVASSEARPIAGVLKGNLYVKGYGDPFLSINEIDQITDQLVNAGIRQIEGSVVGDGTFFDNKTERTQYSGDADQVEALPPIQALTIERGVFTVVISSPRTPGSPCNVQTYPHSAGFEIINNATTASAPARSGRRGRKSSGLLPSIIDQPQRFGDQWPAGASSGIDQRRPAKKPAPVKKPAAKTVAKKGTVAKKTTARVTAATAKKSAPKKAPAPVGKGTQAKATAPENPAATGSRGPLKVSLASTDDGRQIITVNGSLPANRTVSYRYQMKNPALIVAGMIYDRLRSHGITITGGVTSGQASPKSRVLAEAGRPLSEILHLVMKNSNNFLAEYVFKMIGAAAGGQQETAKKSVERIEQRMTLNHVPFGSCIINDGSGLSRANCLCASTLAGILEAAHDNRKVFEAFYEAMSIAGVDGTLRRRMKGTYAEGNVHGKTGTLNNVSALCGYVTTRDGELLCFSMLMNGRGSYHGVQDKVAARLAAFSYTQAPPPTSPASGTKEAASEGGSGRQ
jgi:PBP4 family serine-type D-alanyl-D-alanine carboxypeptidase